MGRWRGSWLGTMIYFDCSAVTTNLGGGKGGFGVVLGKGTDVGIFGGATGDEPDGAGVAEERVGGGDSPDAEFGNEVRGDQQFFFFEGGRVGEEGGGVAIVPDSEKDEIEAGRIAQVVTDLLFVGAGSDLGRADFGMDAFDMDSGAVESFLDHFVVAVFVIGGDPALVPEVEAGGGPRPFQGGEALIEGLGGGAAREGNVKSAPGLQGGAPKGFPTGHHGIEPEGGFGEFVAKHKTKSCQNFRQKR